MFFSRLLPLSPFLPLDMVVLSYHVCVKLTRAKYRHHTNEIKLPQIRHESR